jgi:nucleotide-binding universal stress UspA family protein
VGDWLLMLPFLFASPIAMEVLKAVYRRADAKAAGEAPLEIALEKPRGAHVHRVLVPVDRSHNSLVLMRQIVREFMEDTAMEIHLLNVQRPFNRDIGRFVSRASLRRYHAEQSEKALKPCMQALDRFGIPYATHRMVGDPAVAITGCARRLHCDRIIMATARKNSLLRWVETSVTNRVMALTTVPVEVIAGDEVSGWERFGIPAALTAALALVFAATD